MPTQPKQVTTLMLLDLRIRHLAMFFICATSLAACTFTKQPNPEPPTYVNPIVEQRADPWVHKHSDGYYYFIGSAPEFDRIELRRAKTLNDLKNAEAKVIWRKHESGPMSIHIWAPELHRVNNSWVIYFAAAPADDKWRIRMHALTNNAENPLEGDWQEAGQIKTPENSFALDATRFEHKGKDYLVWAERKDDMNSALWMAELASPTEITGPVIVLSEPTLAWERIGYKVNEGPAVLKKHGRIFMTYSASATDHNYAMGLLWADENADLMNPASWTKSQEPVFYTNEEHKRYGPGHNSFTISEDGQFDVLIYHARPYKELQGNPLSDPNRHARARVIEWSEDGFPLFGQDSAD